MEMLSQTVGSDEVKTEVLKVGLERISVYKIKLADLKRLGPRSPEFWFFEVDNNLYRKPGDARGFGFVVDNYDALQIRQ